MSDGLSRASKGGVAYGADGEDLGEPDAPRPCSRTLLGAVVPWAQHSSRTQLRYVQADLRGAIDASQVVAMA